VELPEPDDLDDLALHKALWCSAWHINALGYDKPELYLKYYADEKTRESWRIDFPDDPIPPSRGPAPPSG
jgi:hypothetical protein